MKQLLTSATAVLLLMACNNVGDDTHIIHNDNTAVRAVAEAVEATTVQSLPLPEFPVLPAPQRTLTAVDSGEIYFPIKSPYDFARVLSGYDDLQESTGKGTLVLPENANSESRVPAMVILHGSGGIQEGREFEYAKLFAENGIASFVVDYYSPRGVTSETPYVMKTMATTEVDIMSDAYSALKILGTHPAIDASRIGVTGYSYGGMATRYVLDDRLRAIMAPDVPRFALHMDLYGPCHQTLGHNGTTGAPYLAIYGDKDNSVDPEVCKDVHQNIADNGSRVEHHIMPGAGHAWETTKPQTTFEGGFVSGCDFSFDTVNGAFLVNGEAGELPAPEMTRAERAFVRAKLGELAGTCVGYGYLVGSDVETDRKSKAIQLAFMKREFGLAD